jgi:ATP-binding cassette subfamily F protein 3
MLRLELHNINKFFGSRQILRDVSVTLAENDIVGLVGNNGAGKSTLCNLITDKDSEFTGQKNFHPGTKVAYFQQLYDSAPEISEQNVFDYVLSTQKEVLALETKYHELIKELETNPTDADILEAFGTVQEEYINKEAYSIMERIETVLSGLGVNEQGDGERNISWYSLMNQLSGGERKIVELATILLNADANVLILDEPTNHLDLKGREWLEEFVKQFKGAVIIVSHDRYLLNRISQHIWEIDNGRVTTYRGNYDKYEKDKLLNRETLLKAYRLQQKELTRLEDLVKELYRKVKIGGGPAIVAQYNATKTRVEKFKETMIDNPMKDKREFHFALPAPSQFGHTALKADAFTFEYSPERKLFEDTSFIVTNGDRTALLGSNGSGKSTLMKLILIRYCLDKGIPFKQYGIEEFAEKHAEQVRQSGIYLGPSVTVGYYSQNHSQLDGSLTIREFLANIGIRDEKQVQGIIRQFQFDARTMEEKYIKDLSGGEKSKLQFLLLMLSGANVLLLDEPINHLDISSMKAIESVLASFKGSVMVISHDRYFLNRIINKVFHIEEKKVKEFFGNYDEFLAVKYGK